MSQHESSRCEERHDDLAAYALGALPAPEIERLEAHLASCPSCTERLRWLQPAVDLVPATVTQYEPPPGLKASLMETVRAEAGEPAPEPEPAESGFARWRNKTRETLFGAGSLRPALAGLAVLCLVVVGVAGYSLGGGDSTEYEVVPQTSKLASAGQLTVEDGNAMLVVDRMANLDSDEVYQVWIEHDGQVSPSEIFVVDNSGHGSVAIPGLPEETDGIMITREPKGGSQTPSSEPMLVAEVS
jgi:anti-sigma-K factor RskA